MDLDRERSEMVVGLEEIFGDILDIVLIRVCNYVLINCKASRKTVNNLPKYHFVND